MVVRTKAQLGVCGDELRGIFLDFGGRLPYHCDGSHDGVLGLFVALESLQRSRIGCVFYGAFHCGGDVLKVVLDTPSTDFASRTK